MKLEVETIVLNTRYPFRIARESKSTVENYIFALTWGGITGLGEAAPLVRQALADAINTDSTLSVLGVYALVVGSEVVTDGDVTEVSIDDPGLTQAPPPIPVPALRPSGIALVIAAMAASLLASQRRRAR